MSIFEITPDGKEALVHFEQSQRELIEQLALHVRRLLTEGDEAGETRSLFPPAYGDDWARQVEFDRLMKDDLTASHLAAIDSLLHLLDSPRANADDVENFIRATNQMRLVMAKWLDVTDATQDEDFDEDNPKYDTWRVYRYLTYVLADALEALDELTDEI